MNSELVFAVSDRGSLAFERKGVKAYDPFEKGIRFLKSRKILGFPFRDTVW